MSGIRIAALGLGAVLIAEAVCGMPLQAAGKGSVKQTPVPTVTVSEEPLATPEPGEPGNPRSSYKLGSARSLEGRNLIYSLFVDTPDAEWTDRDKKIDYEALTKEYKAKGIATIVFVNHKGSTYAICYDGVDNPQESLVMFAGEVPAVYAHEILHLFGAHDLYEDAEYTEEVCEYVKKAYPDEIMYTVKDEKGRLNNSEIQNELSPVTAYHLGWVNYIEEIDVFPQLKR